MWTQHIVSLRCYYVRVFVHKQFLDRVPAQTDVKVARRRWVLLQVMPARLQYDKDVIFCLSSLESSLRYH